MSNDSGPQHPRDPERMSDSELRAAAGLKSGRVPRFLTPPPPASFSNSPELRRLYFFGGGLVLLILFTFLLMPRGGDEEKASAAKEGAAVQAEPSAGEPQEQLTPE